MCQRQRHKLSRDVLLIGDEQEEGAAGDQNRSARTVGTCYSRCKYMYMYTMHAPTWLELSGVSLGQRTKNTCCQIHVEIESTYGARPRETTFNVAFLTAYACVLFRIVRSFSLPLWRFAFWTLSLSIENLWFEREFF